MFSSQESGHYTPFFLQKMTVSKLYRVLVQLVSHRSDGPAVTVWVLCGTAAPCGPGPGVSGAPQGFRQGRAWQPGPVPPPQPGVGQPEDTRAHQPWGFRHLPGERGRPRPGRHVGSRVGPAQRDPWLGSSGLRPAGDRPCCSVRAVAGAGGPGGLTWGPWAVGRVRGAPGEGGQGQSGLLVPAEPCK